MPRLLFPVDIIEFNANEGRLLRLVRILADDGYKVDIVTPSDEVFSKAVETFKEDESVDVFSVKPDVIGLTDSFKDDLVKTFIRQTHNMFFAGTDMKMYKLFAFDDFREYISGGTYPDINICSYDLILMPVLSRDDFPSQASDIFYSTICFLAKEKKIPLIGLQTRPAVQNAFLYAKIMDHIVVKADWEGKYLEQSGIGKKRIFLLTDQRESYCLKSVEDPYMNDFLEFRADKDVKMDKKKFCIVVINHPKFRAQIRQILSTIVQLDLPCVVFLIKVGYNVKELQEKDVIDLVYGDIINKIKGGIYFTDADTKNKLMFLLLSDLTVATTYQEMLGFAAGYGKTAVVYNKEFRDLATDDGVIFMDGPNELKDLILKRYNEKKAGYGCLSDLVGRLCRGKKDKK